MGHTGHHDQIHIWTQGAIEEPSSFFFCPSLTFFFTPFLNLISIFSHSLPSAISLDLSLPPSVLYGKTFLVFYSAPVKPGAYFQCPKLIANVRKDPSSHSPPPPPPPPFLALTVRIRGTFSWPYWTLGFYVFEGVPLYIQLHVFLLNF